MTLITKESRGSYNSVIADINQKIAGIIDKLEALVGKSESDSSKYNDNLNKINNRASNLLEYVNGLLAINKQIDAQMPQSCDYSWSYSDDGCDFNDESSCGE